MLYLCGAAGPVIVLGYPRFFGSPTAPPPGSATIKFEGEAMENVNRRPVAMTLVVLGAVARLVPHPWNFAPVGGMSLFAGARLRGWWAWALPIVLMSITDPLLGGYSRATPFIYLSFLINVWMGLRLPNSESPLRIGSAAVASSMQFFGLSNFAVCLAFCFPPPWPPLVHSYP